MAKKDRKSKYKTQEVAKDATQQFTNSLSGFKLNDLDSYVTDQLRGDYNQFTDYNGILDKYNNQSDAAWDLAKAQQIQAMNKAEAQNYAGTQNAISQMRNTLAGQAASGANRGAANATALQAMLGLGQQNAATTTEGMQGYQNAAREAAAARAENGVNALNTALEGTNSMYDQATSAYGADHTYTGQGIAEATGQLGSAIDTNASSERMNNATNATNWDIANVTQKTRNVNYNYNRK